MTILICDTCKERYKDLGLLVEGEPCPKCSCYSGTLEEDDGA